MTNKMFRPAISAAAEGLVCFLGSIGRILHDYFNNPQVGRVTERLARYKVQHGYPEEKQKTAGGTTGGFVMEPYGEDSCFMGCAV